MTTGPAADRAGTSGGTTPLEDAAVELAREWAAESESDLTAAERTASRRLTAMLADPAGLDLAVRFVDRVARPEDLSVAARELSHMGGADARFLARLDRLLLSLGARVGRLAPSIVVPLARRRLRALVGHLVVDDTDEALTDRLDQARDAGERLNLNLLGEAVLGEDEADRRLGRTIALLRRPGVDHVSVKASSVASQLVPWDLEGGRDRLVHRLLPLYRAARAEGVFVNLALKPTEPLTSTGIDTTSGRAADRVLAAAADLDTADRDRLRRAAVSDAVAWRAEFAPEHDPTGIAAEANVFRYRPLPSLTLWAGAGATRAEVLRVLLVAATAGVLVHLHGPGVPPGPVPGGVHAGPALDPRPGDRIRVLGALPDTLRVAAAHAGASLLDAPVLTDGRRELLTVLREQAISRTRHRFGHLGSGQE